jgi:hypothetical protein
MPQVNRFARLPLAVQREVEQWLIENGFCGYAEIAAELKRRGYRISKSGLHRAAQELKARIIAQELKARIIVEPEA